MRLVVVIFSVFVLVGCSEPPEHQGSYDASHAAKMDKASYGNASTADWYDNSSAMQYDEASYVEAQTAAGISREEAVKAYSLKVSVQQTTGRQGATRKYEK